MLIFLIFQYASILFKPPIRCSSFKTSDIFWAPKLGRGLKHLLIDYKSPKLTDASIGTLYYRYLSFERVKYVRSRYLSDC